MSRKRDQGLLLALLATSLLALGEGRAGDFKVEQGYTSLFNGKDLTGWRQGGKSLDGKTETPNKKWQVIDGAIVIHGGGGGDIFTIKEFNKDFHLKLEFRAAPKADSGLYLRAPQAQLQVRDYPAVGPYKKLTGFKKGDWNELDITVGGSYVTASVNGKALSPKDAFELTLRNGKPAAKLNGKEVEVSNVAVSAGSLALCKCNGEVLEKAFKIPAKGGIGLQSENGKFEFRRIRIKELP